jgi:hypothetical protein
VALLLLQVPAGDDFGGRLLDRQSTTSLSSWRGSGGARHLRSLLEPQTFRSRTMKSSSSPKLEYERWMGERAGAGWSLGPRNDEARTHPAIVQWEELPERERA